jgi:hypothetical protein
MAVPQAVMQRMMGQGGGGPSAGPTAAGATPPPGAEAGASGAMGGPGQSPAAAPMSKPQDKRGLKAAAQTNVHMAINLLEEALPRFGSESQEGGKIIAALKTLGTIIAKKDTSDLVPAEIQQLFQQLPQAGGGTQVQQMIRKMMQQQKAQPAQGA